VFIIINGKILSWNVFNAHKVIVNVFQSRQLLSEFQPEDLNFDLAHEASLLKQLVSLSFIVEIISLLMSIHSWGF
jgi:hypothetical protein